MILKQPHFFFPRRVPASDPGALAGTRLWKKKCVTAAKKDVCLQAIDCDLVVAVVAPGEDKRVAEHDARR
jgi:hypothetical protein